jgi:PKD repeat protein
MKHNIKKTIWLKAGIGLMVIASMFYACQPDVVNPGLGTKPKADFVATVAADGHTVLLANKSSVASMPYWQATDLNLGYSDLKGDSVKINFIFPGNYSVKMLVAGTGGLDSITKTVTTTSADPNACAQTTPLGFLASCTSKVWKMNPAAGAIKCGPNAGDGSWWSNGTADVALRSGFFNDTWTFTFDKAADFVYDDKGDFYDDGYIGTVFSNSTHPSSQYTAAQKTWGSGSFHYAVIPGTGVKGLGQIKLIGLGAHFGVPKSVNGSESPTGPTATSVTYDIWSMQHVSDATGTYDLLMVTLQYMSGGWWTFTLRSY